MNKDRTDIHRALSSRIQKARKNARLTQKALAQRLGLSRGAIANIESGRQGVSVETLFSIGRECRVDPRELLPSPQELAADSTTQTESPKNLEELKNVEQLSEKDRQVVLEALAQQG